MSSSLWINVVVKCGSIIIIPRKILQCSFEDTFGDIVNNLQLTSDLFQATLCFLIPITMFH